MVVHYFSTTYITGGPTNGKKPLPRPKAIRSEILQPLEKTKAIEEVLKNLNFKESRGDLEIYRANSRLFKEAFSPLIIHRLDIEAMTKDQVFCSMECRGEYTKPGYVLFDESRLCLSNCGHASMHL